MQTNIIDATQEVHIFFCIPFRYLLIGGGTGYVIKLKGKVEVLGMLGVVDLQGHLDFFCILSIAFICVA